jgi:hypothetical protein
MTDLREKWPLPGQIDPNITPCAFCRRRIRVQGQPVFQTCSCKALGPPVTIGALATGAVLALAGLWWLAKRGNANR